MAYSKGYKVIQDHALGYQSVDRERENADSIVDAYALEHEATTATVKLVQKTVATALGPMLTSSLASAKSEAALGSHKSFRIPKAIVEVQYITSTSGGVTSGAPYIQMMSRAGWISAVQRVAQGWYFCRLGHIPTDNEAFAEVVPFADDNAGTDVRIAQPRLLTAASVLFAPGLHVYLWELDAGVWSPADYGFSVAFYAS